MTQRIPSARLSITSPLAWLASALITAVACSTEPSASDDDVGGGAGSVGSGGASDGGGEGPETGGAASGGSENAGGAGGEDVGTDPTPVCVAPDATLAFWWTARIDPAAPMLSAHDIYAAVREEMGGAHGSNIGALSWSTSGNGLVGESFVFDTPPNGTQPNYLHAYGDFPYVSVEFWFSTKKTDARLVSTMSGRYDAQLVGGKLRVVFDDNPPPDDEFPGTGPYLVEDSTTLSDDEPHHVVTTLDYLGSGEMRLYLDGELVDSTPLADDFQMGSEFDSMGEIVMGGPLDPGALNPPLSSFFTGLLDEVSLYTGVLSAESVEALYAASSAGKCLPAQSE